MKLKELGELLITAAGIGVAAMVWINIQGRAINSAAAYRLAPVPLVGPIVGSLRAITNQVYDVRGED